MIDKTALTVGIVLLGLPLLAACNGGSQSYDSPPPPNALESLDDLPGGIGPNNEEPDDLPSPA